MPRDEEFRAKEKKYHKMTDDGLIERGAESGEETRISNRERDFDLRRARASPDDLLPQHEGRQKYSRPADGNAQSAEQNAADEMAQDPPFWDDGRSQSESPSQDSRQHSTRYQQRFAEKGGETAQQRSSRLHFTEDELPPEPLGKKLTNARRKAEKTAQRLETAEQNLPARRKLRMDMEADADTGKAKRRLKFEKEPISQGEHLKGAKPLRPIKKGANIAIGYAHKKIYEHEHENVGIEAAHRTELMAESGLRMAYRRRKTAPYRKVSRLQKKAARTSARAAYQQALHDHPELKKNWLSRMWQKQKIKRQYAKAAREAKRAGTAAKKTAVTTEKIASRVVLFVKRHPIIFGIIALLLLLFFLISSIFTSCSSMGTSGLGAITASSYVSEDRDIDNAELYYTEWETDLQMQIENAETDHPGYDEYRYQVDDIGHNPYELMGFLTAVYQEFQYSDVQSVLQSIFAEQYTLDFVEETEIRYRTETRVDPDTGQTYEVQVPYEWHILNINLTAKSFSDIIAGRMNAEQVELYNILMATKGNRQYVSNPFGETNWLPYVTSYYGYRVHPISGGKNFHKGVDIGMAQGTEIVAGQDGVVSQAGDAGDYGLVVVIEGTMQDGRTLTTKYAHCSELLVSAGQEVKKGDVIAKVGSTGNSTGPHLHLEVLVDGQHLNPLYFADTGDHTFGSLAPGSPGGPEIPAYPGAPMGDGSYAALMEESQKHLGKPYVFGAKGPDSFDCSGFVCYSLRESGVKNIATNAQGLYNACTPVSRANAQPGDLIFFQGTYSTPNTVTHVGIYIGNGMMIHAGKPVQYASIDTAYWTEHFYAFGRLN